MNDAHELPARLSLHVLNILGISPERYKAAGGTVLDDKDDEAEYFQKFKDARQHIGYGNRAQRRAGMKKRRNNNAR